MVEIRELTKLYLKQRFGLILKRELSMPLTMLTCRFLRVKLWVWSANPVAENPAGSLDDQIGKAFLRLYNF